VLQTSLTTARRAPELRLEQHRAELTGYCYRMLGSPFDAEDAVQETLLRAWRAFESFEGRSAVRSWLYKIATNVCLDMLGGRSRRARPMDLGPASAPVADNLGTLPEASWIQPIPDSTLGSGGNPEEIAFERETIRLAFIAALQHLPPRQRAALILCEVLRWRASEVADLLETSVASVNSALQRARSTLEACSVSAGDAPASVEFEQRDLLRRYVEAFESYDMDKLTALIREDAIQSMPPYDLWLARAPRHPCVVVRAGPAMPRIPAHPSRYRERLGCVRSISSKRGGPRLRALGSAGARFEPGRDRRVHRVPGGRATIPAVRAAGAA
jgi:RNA polymerase sigma-70 factor, ECF subfamily